MSALNQHLMACALTGTYDGIENRIGWHLSLTNFKNPRSSLFTIQFGGNHQPNLSDFVDYFYYKLVQFCIPPNRRADAHSKFARTNDERYIQEITDQAKNLFLKATDENVRSGEPGELILYSILEWYFRAPQIVCKMFLKTSRQMPVHGSDGIHVLLEPDNQTLNFVWGESKVYQDMNTAVDRALDSIHTLVTHAETPIARDIEILKDHHHVLNEDLKRAILDSLDCYSESSNKKKYSFAILVAFDCDKLQACRDPGDRVVFFEDYLKRAESASGRFLERAKSLNLDNYEFIFILLPFASVSDFRKMFFRRLGRDTD